MENLHTPLVRQYNLGVQWEFLPRWVLDVGFVGSSGINLADYNHNYNTALLASPSNPINGVTTNTVANANLRVPYLGFAASGFQGTGFDGISNYNSLQSDGRGMQLSRGVLDVRPRTPGAGRSTDVIGLRRRTANEASRSGAAVWPGRIPTGRSGSS